MKITGLSKSFGPTAVYADFNLTFPSGKTSCLLGPSGCGKTTLLNLAAGVVNRERGDVTIAVEPANRLPKISYMFQEPRLLPWLSVTGNLMYAQEGGLSRHERKERAREMITLVGLAGAEEKLPRELSGGMARRVGLARALLTDFDLFLMDEPLASLDQELKEKLILLLKERLQGKTAVLVTHDYNTARQLSDHIFVMTAPPVKAREINISELKVILDEINRD